MVTCSPHGSVFCRRPHAPGSMGVSGAQSLPAQPDLVSEGPALLISDKLGASLLYGSMCFLYPFFHDIFMRWERWTLFTFIF